MKTLDFINRLKQEEKIYIYGAGYYGRILRSFLDENNIKVEGFLVSRKQEDLNNLTVLELPVYNIDRFMRAESFDSCVIISVSGKYMQEIKVLLDSYGIKDVLIIDDSLFSDIVSKLGFVNCYNGINNINVFLYHRVGAFEANRRGLVINEDLFEKQLVYIKDNYRLLKTDDDWEGVSDKAAVITFDDGYYDFYGIALPLLEKHKIPATVFVATGNIDTNGLFWGDALELLIFKTQTKIKNIVIDGKTFKIETEKDRCTTFFELRKYFKNMSFDERNKAISMLAELLGVDPLQWSEFYRTMTADEIYKAAKSKYVTIGAHTVTHCCLSSESLERQRYELACSKRRLEEITGKSVNVFAYPYGEEEDFDGNTISIAKEVGFSRVFAAYKGVANCYSEYGYIPRIDISKANDFENSIRELQLINLCYADRYV